MKWILLCLLFFGCSDDPHGIGSIAIPTAPGFWANWKSTTNDWNLDLRNGDFYENVTFYANVKLTSDWLTVLNNRGRDTTGLTAGTYFLCEYDMYASGDSDSGGFALNHDDIDTPEHNVCTFLDSNCVLGVCNVAADHTYTIDTYGSNVESTMYLYFFGNPSDFEILTACASGWEVDYYGCQ